MSIKDDVARLRRLGNSNSPQWKKARVAIEEVLTESVFRLLPRTFIRGQLPWGYNLYYESRYKFCLWKLNFGRSRTLLKITNDSSDVQDIVLFAEDIHNGWLTEVSAFLEVKYARLNEASNTTNESLAEEFEDTRRQNRS